jgi:hypothetical protein
MAKQRNKHPSEDNPDLEAFRKWMASPEGQLFDKVCETVSLSLEEANVDAKGRKIIWPDGTRLSLTESMQRFQAEHPDFPLDMIDEALITWLEGEFAPPDYSEEQLEELGRLTEKWVDDYERQAEAQSKHGRTRHS